MKPCEILYIKQSFGRISKVYQTARKGVHFYPSKNPAYQRLTSGVKAKAIVSFTSVPSLWV